MSEIKISTLIRDKKIMKFMKKGFTPKQIAEKLIITTYVVYDAVRRKERSIRNNPK